MGKTKNVMMSGEATPSEKVKVDKYAVKKAEAAEAAAKKAQPKHGKNILSARNKVNKNTEYSLPEAINLVRETSFTKFDATVEFHGTVRKQGLSLSVTFPHTFGSEKRVVFATDATVAELEAGKINFDVLLATAEMMPKLVKFAKLLGPRGMMPNPKNGTLVKDEKAIKNFSTSVTAIKTEKDAPLIHLAVGKVSMEDKKIQENLETLFKALGDKQLKKAVLSSSMGPSIRLKIA